MFKFYPYIYCQNYIFMDITIGEYTVLASGTVITIPNEWTVFQIENLKYKFRFINTEDKVQKISPNSVDKTTIELTFNNFDNPLQVGNTTPLHLGSLGEKSLFLQYRVQSLSEDTGKTLHYTWMVKADKEAIDNNTNENGAAK